jgi:hypothetical protein
MAVRPTLKQLRAKLPRLLRSYNHAPASERKTAVKQAMKAN